MKKRLLLSILPVAILAVGASALVPDKEIVPGGIPVSPRSQNLFGKYLQQTSDRSTVQSNKSRTLFDSEGQRLQDTGTTGLQIKVASKSGDDAEFNVTYRIIAPEGKEGFMVGPVALYDADNEFIGGFYMSDKRYEQVYPEKTVEALEPAPAGVYEMLAWGLLQTGEFSYVGYCTHAPVEITEDGQVVTVDFSACHNRLRLNCNQGNGEPFPQFDPDTEGELRSLNFDGTFGYGDLSWSYMFSGTDDFEMMVSDFEEEGIAFFNASFEYLDFGNMTGTSSGAGIPSPFVSDFVGTIQQKYMKLLTNETSLSPADKAMTVRSMCTGSLTLDVEEFGGGMVSVNTMSMGTCTWMDGTPSSEMSAYIDLGLNHQPNFHWEDCGYTGFRAYSDDDYVYKYSGPTTYFDNKPVVVGWTHYYNGGEYTFLHPKEVFNINPEQQKIVNFLNPLYAQSDAAFYKDWNGEDQIGMAFLGKAGYYGMFHEELNAGEDIILKKVYYDGEEVESFDALSGKPYDGHSVKYCLEYPDGWVQDKFPAKFRNEVTIALSDDRAKDSRAPSLENFQICNSEGQITGQFKRGESAKLYLGLKDYNASYQTDTNTEIILRCAPVNSDNWIEITPEVAEVLENNNGWYCEYTLDAADFSEDVWYTVVVEALDSSGNSMKQTMEYCFIFVEGTGVALPTGDGDQRARTRYFNLQGMEIENPIPGLNIVVDGDGVKKTIIR